MSAGCLQARRGVQSAYTRTHMLAAAETGGRRACALKGAHVAGPFGGLSWSPPPSTVGRGVSVFWLALVWVLVDFESALCNGRASAPCLGTRPRHCTLLDSPPVWKLGLGGGLATRQKARTYFETHAACTTLTSCYQAFCAPPTGGPHSRQQPLQAATTVVQLLLVRVGSAAQMQTICILSTHMTDSWWMMPFAPLPSIFCCNMAMRFAPCHAHVAMCFCRPLCLLLFDQL